MKHDESILEHQKHGIYIYIVIKNWTFNLDADTAGGFFRAAVWGLNEARELHPVNNGDIGHVEKPECVDPIPRQTIGFPHLFV